MNFKSTRSNSAKKVRALLRHPLLHLALTAANLLSPIQIHADCSSPAGKAGQFQYNSGIYQVCDGGGWSSLAAAAPSGTCSLTGELSYSAGPRYCNGSLYTSMAGTETGASCSGTTTGTIQYFSSLGYMQWCNGTNWKPMRNASSGIAYVRQGLLNNYNGGATYTVSMGGNVATGNLLVCMVLYNDKTASTSSVVATGSQALTRAVASTPMNGTGAAANFTGELWYKEGVTGSTSTSLVVTLSKSVTGFDALCNEYSGIVAAGALDQTAAVAGTTGPTATAGPVTNTTAKSLLFAYGCWEAVASGGTAAGTGYVQRGSNNDDCITEDQIVTALGSYSATLGGGASGSKGNLLMATFRGK